MVEVRYHSYPILTFGGFYPGPLNLLFLTIILRCLLLTFGYYSFLNVVSLLYTREGSTTHRQI